MRRRQSITGDSGMTKKETQEGRQRLGRTVGVNLPEPGGLVHLDESEERFEVTLLSIANQAAALKRISRSSFSRLTSRRKRRSSSRSPLVRPPSPPPAFRASGLTYSATVHAEGPNSLAKEAGLRPALTKSTICRLKSAVYRTVRSAINTSVPYVEVSTKAGQLQVAIALSLSQHVRRNLIDANAGSHLGLRPHINGP